MATMRGEPDEDSAGSEAAVSFESERNVRRARAPSGRRQLCPIIPVSNATGWSTAWRRHRFLPYNAFMIVEVRRRVNCEPHPSATLRTGQLNRGKAAPTFPYVWRYMLPLGIVSASCQARCRASKRITSTSRPSG
jgi:hypothetical protein